MKKKTFVYLTGGLGNQMFQYAFARNYSEIHNTDLVLDRWSGFIRDKEYNRKFELEKLNITGRYANIFEIFPIWLYKLQEKIKSTKNIISKRFYGTFNKEINLNFQKESVYNYINESVWILGYWQNPNYFIDSTSILLEELMPPTSKINKFKNLACMIRENESIALGIRLYEESKTPLIHSRDGRLKTIDEIQNVINTLISQINNPKFFIFCTFRSKLLDRLILPNDSVFVTHDDGYEGSTDRLWLLSQCKHHVMTNSSFYWWGAWLSQKNYPNKKQLIYASDNFNNLNTVPKEWNVF